MRAEYQELNCKQVAGLATDYLDGALGGVALEAAEKHLASCPECRRFVEQLEVTVQWAESVKAPNPPSERTEELVMLLAQTDATPESDCLLIDATKAQAYLSDSLSDAEQIAVFNHLIEGCEACALRCRSVAFPQLGGVVAVRKEVRERAASESEANCYRGLIGEHLTLGGSAWSAGIDLEHFLLWLIRRGREQLTAKPAEASRIANLALEVAAELGDESQARAAMLKGHIVRKVDADFEEAESWFQRAEASLVSLDTDGWLLRAKLLRIRAHARFSQSLASDAIELFEQAERIYLNFEEVARFGECLVDKAAAVAEISGPEEAIRLCLAASSIVAWSAFPRYGMAVSQNLALYYSDAGRCGRALLALRLARQRLKGLGHLPVDRSQLDWTSGRILNAAGRFEEAVSVLEEVRHNFIAEGLASKTAWVSLDLAIGLTELGRIDQLQEVSEPMIAHFVSRRLPTETLVAIRLFREAILSRTVAAVQIRALTTLLAAAKTGGQETWCEGGGEVR